VAGRQKRFCLKITAKYWFAAAGSVALGAAYGLPAFQQEESRRRAGICRKNQTGEGKAAESHPIPYLIQINPP